MEASVPTLAAVREAHPSELAVLLSTLTVDDVLSLGADGCEAMVVATQRVASWAHALQAATVDRFAELVTDTLEVHVADLRARGLTRHGRTDQAERSLPLPVPEPDTIAASSLAPLLNIAPRTMRTRLNRARVLVELPRTFALALDGVLEPWRADAVVQAARDVAPDRVEEFEARLYDTDVTALPKPRLAARAHAAATKADPDSSTRARAAAPRRRALRWAPSDTPGLMRWTADLPDHTSRTLAAAVDTLAQEYLVANQHARARDRASAAGAGGTERLSVAAARADAMVDLIRANATVTTTVELVIPAATATVPTAITRPTKDQVIRDTLSTPTGWRRAAGVGAGLGAPAAAVPDHAVSEGGAGPVVEVVRPLDTVLVDLVAGTITRDTLAAGHLERHHGMRLGQHLETAGNPFLTTTPPTPPPPTPPPPPSPGRTRSASTQPCGQDEEGERIWFVPGLVQVPGTTGLLPDQVTALLDDLDTRVRVTTAQPGTADGPPHRRRTYRPGTALAAKVRARDGHCRFPGCSVPATRCDLDHVIPHPLGLTVEANLHALCRTHHGFKHHAGWLLTMTPDGHCTWTAPTGRTHTTHPDHAA